MRSSMEWNLSLSLAAVAVLMAGCSPDYGIDQPDDDDSGDDDSTPADDDSGDDDSTAADDDSTASDDDTSGDDDTAAAVGWCNLQWPPTLEATAGDPAAGPVYGRVYVAGTTPGPGQGPGVQGQIGVGPSGTDPASDASWTWTEAAYNADYDGLIPGDLSNDEYAATFPAPGAGTWSYAFRFSTDGGATFTPCDLTGTDDGWGQGDAGALTVR